MAHELGHRGDDARTRHRSPRCVAVVRHGTTGSGEREDLVSHHEFLLWFSGSWTWSAVASQPSFVTMLPPSDQWKPTLRERYLSWRR